MLGLASGVPYSGGWQTAMAVVLLTPMTVLMGGTLTVLVRAFVRANPGSAGWSVGLLYGASPIGTAPGPS